MTAEELKAIQAPIKESYRSQPESAKVILKASGQIGDGVSCRVETGRKLVEAGLHPATGGTGMLVCSGDMLLEALVACAGVTMGAVSTALGIKLKRGIVRAEGDIDFRGTLGVSKDVPVGFEKIRLKFLIEAEASDEQIQTLIRLTERYCVVYQTLSNGASVDVSYQTTLID